MPTFFVDRCLGRSVGDRLRDAGASVVLHDDRFDPVTPDATWIADVTADGWVILTKDKNIRRPGGERDDVLRAGARVFTLTSGNMTREAMAETFVDHLAEICRVAESQTPPFVCAVGPAGVWLLVPAPPADPEPPEAGSTDVDAPGPAAG